MNNIIVRPKNKKQSEELQTILQKMKVKFFISDSEKEDQGLMTAMLKIDDENESILSKVSNKYWYIKRGQIDDCKMCEFRFNCLDKTIPLKSVDSYVLSSTCKFSPHER